MNRQVKLQDIDRLLEECDIGLMAAGDIDEQPSSVETSLHTIATALTAIAYMLRRVQSEEKYGAALNVQTIN